MNPDIVARLEMWRSGMRLAISVAECGEALGLGRTKIYELINSGELESLRVGRRRLIKLASVNALLSPDPSAQPDGQCNGTVGM